MPKSITIDPVDVRRPSILESPDIPINHYISDSEAEAKKYGLNNGNHPLKQDQS